MVVQRPTINERLDWPRDHERTVLAAMSGFLLSLLLTYLALHSWTKYTTVAEQPPRAVVALYRILSNDNVPLQSVGQTRGSLATILKNEPNIIDASVEKKWMINRVWNHTEFGLTYDMLIGGGVSPRNILLRCFDLHLYNSFAPDSDKLLYIASQNEARSHAVKDAQKGGYEWTILLDGPVLVSDEDWTIMNRAISDATLSSRKYVKVPLRRTHFYLIHNSESHPFHVHSTQHPNYYETSLNPPPSDWQCGTNSSKCLCSYKFVDPQTKSGSGGGSTRTALITRPKESKMDTPACKALCNKVFAKEGLCYHSVAHHFSQKRLFLDLEDVSDRYNGLYRGASRDKSTQYSRCMQLEAETIFTTPLSSASTPNVKKPMARERHLIAYDLATLKDEKNRFRSDSSQNSPVTPYVMQIVRMADVYGMKSGPFSVINKTLAIREEKDKRFYYSSRPYFWAPRDVPRADWHLYNITDKNVDTWTERDRNPHSTFPNLARVHIDGFRAPGTRIGEPRCEQFDRTEAWYLIDNVTTLALAWFFTDDVKYSDRAAGLVDTWFLNKKTAMYPNLKHAQDGSNTGLIDWKDIYYLIDALILVEQAGAFTKKQTDKLEKWCSDLAEWYIRSPQGQDEVHVNNNHALYFDLSVMSLSLFAHRDDLVFYSAVRLTRRLQRVYPRGHFKLDGSQPAEAQRPTGLHYVTFNLVGWIHTAIATEAAKQAVDESYVIPSLFTMLHEEPLEDDAEEDEDEEDEEEEEGEDKEDKADKSRRKLDENQTPVLLKAIRWLLQYLPSTNSHYDHHVSGPEALKLSSFPYTQPNEYSFDRLLEILHIGANVYGSATLWVPGDKISEKKVKQALKFPLYSLKVAQMSSSSSVHPDYGSRAWSAVGLLKSL